jgi:hypothetical protein
MVENERGAAPSHARVRMSRVAAGAGWGVLATVAMSVVMVVGVATDVAPMPEPIPAALVTRTLGTLPQPAVLVLAVATHLSYGAAAGAVLAGLLRRVTVWHALAYAAVLWAVMGLAWLPYLGWGLFGTAVAPTVAAATLVLHVTYGLVLGLLLDRNAGHAGSLGNLRGVSP